MSNSLEGEILSRGLDDIIQLSEIVSVARFKLGIEEGPDLFDIVGKCLRVLVGETLAIFGDLDESKAPLTIQAWSGDAEAIADRAVSEWKALSRSPGLAEIGWLELTDAGRTEARQRLS